MSDMMQDMMGAAIGESFGALVEQKVAEAVRPLYEQIVKLTDEIIRLHNAQAQVIALVDQAKSKGGMAAKFLGL